MEILGLVFNMSIVGSIMFLIFLLIKSISKKHFNSSWHYIMLILILILFIIPVNSLIRLPVNPIPNIPKLEIGESIVPKNINTKEAIKGVENNIGMEKETSEYTVGQVNEVKDRDIQHIKVENRESENIKSNINNYKDMILYIWIIGAITLLLMKFIPYIRFKSSILRNSTIVDKENIVKLFNKCKGELNINTNIKLRTCSRVGSPMLIGIFNPMVVISNIDEDHKRLKMILMHELNHHKRRDLIIKAISLIINAIHWFNPLTFILLREIDKYCEYSIDEIVVEEMDINDRKYYGETILNVASSFRFKKPSLTTAMGSSGKQLKTRLENMIYSFKLTRRKQIMSLFAASLILISGLTVACSILPNNNLEDNDSFAVYIKEDGLYYSYLNGEDETRIHDGNNFEYPLISSGGNYIAYTKEDSLFIYNVKDESYEKIADGIEHYYRSYDWIDDTSIIYGLGEKPGFETLNLLSKERRTHLDEYYYTGLMSSNNMVYGRKVSKWTTAEGNFMANDGIVEINVNNYDKSNKQFSTNIIVEGRKSIDGIIGYNPVVWDISPDGSYIYIMEKPASGSLSSDEIGIGIYDVKEKTHTEFADIDTLSYKNHLTINPTRNMIGLIEGDGREMIENKEVVLLDINKDKTFRTINFMDRDLVAMTPSFSLDGKRLLYSATKNLGQVTMGSETSIYERWDNQPHNIYEYDLESPGVRQITDGQYFDFMPVDISNNEMLFTRYKGDDYYSLIKLVNGKEYIVADNIKFRGGSDNYPFGFYGHIHTEMGMDIFISKNNKSNEEKDVDIGKMDELYKLKETYIGDNSNVSNIINLLDFPEELTPNGMELFTKEEPFGLQINLQASDEIIAKYMSTSSDYDWRPQSLILFSLIDNLGYIQYGINSDKARITASYINRQVADSLTMSTLGHRVSEVAASKKAFKEFYNIYGSEHNIKRNQPEGLVGHIVIEDNILHFRQVEIVEWDDQERVKVLDLSQSDFPNGYSIIDKNNKETTFQLTDETIYTFTDVNLLFVNEAESNRLYTTTKKEEFLQHLGQYNSNDTPLLEQKLPYFIEVLDGKVISITEKFKYTI